MEEKKIKSVNPLKNPSDIKPRNTMPIVDENKNSVVCIIGMHRSGTSMVTRLLNVCGLDLGTPEQLEEAREENPLGFYENKGFMDINEKLLAHLGGTWDNPPLFKKEWEHDPSLAQIVQEARSLLETFSNSHHWGWKDPRTTILLPFWKSLIPNLRFVICVRSPLEVARSLAKRNEMPIHRGVYLWNQYMQAAVRDTEGYARIFVFYEDFFQEEMREIDRLVGFCHLKKPDDPSMLCNAISKELKHYTCETYDLLSDDEIMTEYKLFYIGMRALSYEGFLRSQVNGSGEKLVSENIGKFSRLFEALHDEQSIVESQSILAASKVEIDVWKRKSADLERIIASREEHISNLMEHTKNLETAIAGREEHIRNLEGVIAGREEHISNLTEHTRNLEKVITDREEHISNLLEHTKDLKAVIAHREKSISATLRRSISRIWKRS